MAVSSAAGRPAHAQEVGAAFLLLPASTRTMAMGGVGIATESPAALFDDVAGMEGEGGAAALAVQRHLGGTRAATAAAGYGAGAWTVGVGVHVLDYGEIDEVVPDPASGGEIGAPTGARLGASDFALAAGVARGFGRVRVGLATRLVRQQVAEASGNAVTVDAGVRIPVFAGTMLSAGVQHLGERIDLAGRDAEMPTSWRVGIASPAIAVAATELRVVGELSGVRRADMVAAAGGEVTWSVSRDVRLAGRVGLRAVPNGDEVSPLTLGGALLGRRVGISYAYRGYGALGGVHRVGVSLGGRE